MQEDEQDTDGADILHQEQIEMEEPPIAKRTPVCKFITYDLMWHKPADKDTGEEAHDRQEQLAGDEIEYVEDRHAEES